MADSLPSRSCLGELPRPRVGDEAIPFGDDLHDRGGGRAEIEVFERTIDSLGEGFDCSVERERSSRGPVNPRNASRATASEEREDSVDQVAQVIGELVGSVCQELFTKVSITDSWHVP